MILYGRLLSPFVRRVAVAARLQGHVIERRDLLVTGDDFARVRELNPIGRVPVLVLDDGTPLMETYAIMDWLDETSPNGVRMLPSSGVERRAAFQRLAHGQGTVEKAVALVYERNRRPDQFHWPEWQQRLVAQIQGGLQAMDGWVPEAGWSGPDGPDGGDIAAAIAYQFIETTNPWVLEPTYGRLKAFTARAMAEMPGFADSKPSA